MNMVQLTCSNKNCAAPNWERQATRGKRPKLCPECAEQSAKPKGPIMIICVDCSTEWSWERMGPGRQPVRCVSCKVNKTEEADVRREAKQAAKLEEAERETVAPEETEKEDVDPVFVAPVASTNVKKGRDIVKVENISDFANAICFTQIEKALQEVNTPQDQINDSNNSQEFLIRAIVECARSGSPKLGPTGEAIVAKYEAWVDGTDLRDLVDPAPPQESFVEDVAEV